MENKFKITKTEPDKMLVFGWGNVAIRKDGTQIEDHQGDVIDPEELEKSAYEHVLNFRSTGERHDPELRKKGRLVESCVFTKEKQEAIGIPPDTVPVGWWVGFKIDDPEAWEKIKNHEYNMFSVEGTGEREEIQKFDRVAKRYSEAKAELKKYNPYHDGNGRFASKKGFKSYSVNRTIKNPVLGDNSFSKHYDQQTGKVSTERAKVYNQFINSVIGNVDPPESGNPTIHFMGGGGGSGKGYTISTGTVRVPDQTKAAHINADDIKIQFDEFKQRARSSDPKTSLGAADYVHKESSLVADMVTKAAMSKGVNIVMDGVASDPNKVGKQIAEAKKQGYTTNAHYIATPLEVAIEANRKRYYENKNLEERRMVPREVIVDAHRQVSKNFHELADLYDKVEVVTNDQKSPSKRIAYKDKSGKLIVTDQEAFQAFIDKKDYK